MILSHSKLRPVPHSKPSWKTSPQLWYGFMFAFYSNYGAILYRLRAIASYLSKIVKFLYVSPPVFSAHEKDDPVGISQNMWPYNDCIVRTVCVLWRNYDNTLSRFHRIPERDGRTQLLYQYRVHVSMLTRDKNATTTNMAPRRQRERSIKLQLNCKCACYCVTGNM